MAPLVEAAVRSNTSHKQNVRVKNNDLVAYDADEICVAKNTFLCSSWFEKDF